MYQMWHSMLCLTDYGSSIVIVTEVMDIGWHSACILEESKLYKLTLQLSNDLSSCTSAPRCSSTHFLLLSFLTRGFFWFHRILSFPSRWTWFSACLLRNVNRVLFSDGTCRWLIMYWGVLIHWCWRWSSSPCNERSFTFWIFQWFSWLINGYANFLGFK
jgi:hypothetical protein